MKGVTACVCVFYVCVWKNEQNLLCFFFSVVCISLALLADLSN